MSTAVEASSLGRLPFREIVASRNVVDGVSIDCPQLSAGKHTEICDWFEVSGISDRGQDRISSHLRRLINNFTLSILQLDARPGQLSKILLISRKEKARNRHTSGSIRVRHASNSTTWTTCVMSSREPPVADFVDNFDLYRLYDTSPRGWYETKGGTTATGWHEVKEVEASNRCWFRRIFSQKKNVERSSAALTGLKYSSKPFYRLRKEDGTRVTKLLPTITIPNLPRESWRPTEGHHAVTKEIKIMTFEADGYTLGRDPSFPSRRERVSGIPSPEKRPATPRPAPREEIGQRQRWNRWLRSRASWTSGSTVLTWTDSDVSTTEPDTISMESEPDMEDFRWIEPAVSAQERVEEVPRAEAWNDNSRIWFALPSPLNATIGSRDYF